MLTKSKKLSSNYLDDSAAVSIGVENREDASMPFFDSKKTQFKLRTRLMSTIYPKEPALSRFFTDCSPFLNVIQHNKNHNMRFINTALNAAMDAIRELTVVSFTRLISHYTLVLDMLFSIICRTQDVLHNFVNANSKENKDEENEEYMSDRTGTRSGIFSSSPSDNRMNAIGAIRLSKNRKSVVMSSNNEPKQPTNTQEKHNSHNFKRKSKDTNLAVSTSPSNSRSQSPTNPTTPTFKEKIKSRMSIKLSKTFANTSEEEFKSSSQVNEHVPQPGDPDFILMDYLKQKEDPPKESSSVSNETLKKKRFSIFAATKRSTSLTSSNTPVTQTVPVLKPLIKKVAQDEDADNLSYFLTVSSNIFELQKTLFQALIAMLKGAGFAEDSSDPSNRLLTSYVQYVFKDILMTSSPLCFVLCELWTDMLSKADEDLQINISTEGIEGDAVDQSYNGANTPRLRTKSMRLSTARQDQGEMDAIARKNSYRKSSSLYKTPVYVESLQFAWFFFDIIVKSFTIHMESYRESKQDENGNDIIDDKFDRSTSGYKLASLLKELIRTLADKIRDYKDDFVHSSLSKRVNQQLAFFFRDLFDCGHIQAKVSIFKINNDSLF